MEAASHPSMAADPLPTDTPIADCLRSPTDYSGDQESLPHRPLLCTLSYDDTTLIAVDCLGGDKAVHRIPLPDQLDGHELFSSIGHCLLLEMRNMGPSSGIRLFDPFSSSAQLSCCLPPSTSVVLHPDSYSGRRFITSLSRIHMVVIDTKRRIALALLSDSDCRIAYTTLDSSNWIDLTHLLSDHRTYFQAALLYEDSFYAVDETGTKVFALCFSETVRLDDMTFDLHDAIDHRFEAVDYCCYQSASLVTSGSSLFLVRWMTTLWKDSVEPSRDIHVFVLDHFRKKWVRVESLGDHSFFIGTNLSFSASAVDFPDLRGNRVYLCSDAHTPVYGNMYRFTYGHDDRDEFLSHLVYNLEDGTWDVFYDDESPSQIDYCPLFSVWMLPPAV